MNVSGETESRRNEIAARVLGIKHRLPKYAPSQTINTERGKKLTESTTMMNFELVNAHRDTELA
jgi:hypothetical protein